MLHPTISARSSRSYVENKPHNTPRWVRLREHNWPDITQSALFSSRDLDRNCSPELTLHLTPGRGAEVTDLCSQRYSSQPLVLPCPSGPLEGPLVMDGAPDHSPLLSFPWARKYPQTCFPSAITHIAWGELLTPLQHCIRKSNTPDLT